MGMFDDMMSSGRGPGVIGTLMALLVIVGFGSLYFFVFDEGMRGGDKSIESVIRDNGKDIDNLTTQIESRKKSLEGSPALIRIASEVEETARLTRMGKGTVEGQMETVAKARSDLSAKEKEFNDYKQSYREQVRAEGKGITYPELKTLSGKVYQRVTITKVDPSSISFQHLDGLGRADFEDLAEEIRERFQYDANEGKQNIVKVTAITTAHNNATNAAIVEQQRLAKIEEEKRRAAARQKATEEYAAQRGRLDDYDQKITDAERAMTRDSRTKFFDRAKHERIVNGLKAGRASVQALVNQAKETLERTSE